MITAAAPDDEDAGPEGARQPRGLVNFNGEFMPGCISWDTEANEFTAPDTFSAIFAMSELPPGRDAAWLADVGMIDVEVFGGIPSDPENFTSGDLVSIFVGTVDQVSHNWDTRTINVSGRDLTAKLIDHKTSEKYINLTSSQIAEKIAGKYGLTPKVTATTTKAGKLYSQDHVDLKDERTEWDLITWLAQKEGFAVFVRGRELHFQKRPEATDKAAFTIKREAATAQHVESGNYVSLQTSRDLTVAGDIKVTVKSWNTKQKAAFTKTAKKTGKGSGPSNKQEYTYTIPNLQPDEAQTRAETILAQISRHAVRLSFSGVGGPKLEIDDIVKLTGTETAYDQAYFPESIHREMSQDGGYEWSVEAKNHPTEDEPKL